MRKLVILGLKKLKENHSNVTGWEVFPWQSPKIYRSPNFYFFIQFMHA